MKVLEYTFETNVSFSEPVTKHDFLLRCQPGNLSCQRVMHGQVTLFPATRTSEQRDGFGNRILMGRIAAGHDRFGFISTGLVLSGETDALEAPGHAMYLKPSEFADESSALRALSREVLSGMGSADPWAQAQALSHAVWDRMDYEPGTTDVSTTASQALALGHGVCQDYAHILISLCRAAGIQAQYVSGLILGHGASHAWVNVFDGTSWRGIDPTNDRACDDGYIILSMGRDFGDCPIDSGVFRGGVTQEQTVTVHVTTR